MREIGKKREEEVKMENMIMFVCQKLIYNLIIYIKQKKVITGGREKKIIHKQIIQHPKKYNNKNKRRIIKH